MRLLNSLFHVERIRFICPKAPVIRLYRLVIRPESGLPELSFPDQSSLASVLLRWIGIEWHYNQTTLLF